MTNARQPELMLTFGASIKDAKSYAVAGRWNCECGWTGLPSRLRINAAGICCCPGCGSTVGVHLKYDAPALIPELVSFSDEWNTLLAGSPAAERVRFHVSAKWSTEVSERMNDPGLCMRLLWRTGLITEYGPACARGSPLRTIYMTMGQVRALHDRYGLIQAWHEPAYAWFRMREDGEAPSARLMEPMGD